MNYQGLAIQNMLKNFTNNRFTRTANASVALALIFSFVFSPLASLVGLGIQTVFAEPPANGVYGYAITTGEAALEGVNVQLQCNTEGGWNGFSVTDEDGEYWTTSEDLGTALVSAGCGDGDTILVRGVIAGYNQVGGDWSGEVPVITLDDGEDIQQWAERVFSNSVEAYFIFESDVSPLDFNEPVNKAGAPGATVVIDDIVIIGGEADDVLDLNLYATGGTFSYDIVGEVDDEGTDNNVQFRGTRTDLNATLQTLTFSSINSGEFRVEARIGGQDGEIYNPENGHIYRIVSNSLTWSQARDAAANMEYGGVDGYLATITSPKEHSIVVERITGDGWIGANDIANEGVWRWVTGPEANQQFWQGNGTSTGGYAVNGMFANWANNEPNNASDEDCAEFRTSQGGRWNDIGCNNPRPNYVVEFGAYDDLPAVVMTSFTVTIDLMDENNNILSCGVVIEESGEYRLTSNLTLGTFQEDCITIIADDVTLDGSGYTISGHANTEDENGVFVDDADNVVIKNLNIVGFYDAIYAYDSSDITITDNVIQSSYDDSIDIEFSSGVIITNNSIINTANDGIIIQEVVGITIENNTLESVGDDGIYLDYTSPFVIRDNTIQASEVGIEVEGWDSEGEMLIINNEITSGEWSIDLDEIGGVEVLNNRIQSNEWVRNRDVDEDLGPNIFHKDGRGNRYYFANGDGAWTKFDIKDNNRDGWADIGSDLPFTHGLSVDGELDSSSTKGQDPDWFWYSGNDEDVSGLFDNDESVGLTITNEGETIEFQYNLGQGARNVKWHIAHDNGVSVIDIPEDCYIGDWETPIALLGLTINNLDERLDLQCAYGSSEGAHWNWDFNQSIDGLSYPISVYETWVTYDSENVMMLWMGEGEDAHPWTELSVGGGSTSGSVSGGRTAASRLNFDREALINQIRNLVGALLEKGISVPAQLQTWFREGQTSTNNNFVAPTFCSDGLRDLQNGSEGEEVKSLQNLLMTRGYSIPPGATGFFANYTQSALSAYQRDNGIAPSAGYFGCITRAQMKSAGHPGLWW